MLSGLSRDKLFILVAATIAITNTLIVQFGGGIFGTEALALNQWIVVYGNAFSAIVLATVVNFMIDKLRK